MGRLGRLRVLLRDGWWVPASVAVAVCVGVLSGGATATLIVLPAYALANSAGVKLYCDHHRDRHARRRRVVQLLAVALVPTGFAAVLFTPGGMTLSEASADGSPDERIRQASARASAGGSWRGGGGHG